MIHVFYHKRDLDGYCSGAITKHHLLHNHDIPDEEIKMWPYDYGEVFPFSEIEDGEHVWMVDVTTNPYEMMLEIGKKYNLFVIDHHKSFIEFQVANKIHGYFEIGKSACELAWEYCYPEYSLPHLVFLLGRYDVWDKSNEKLWNNQILPTQMGIKLNNTDPGTKEGYNFWESYFNNNFNKRSSETEEKINKQGATILKYQGIEDDKATAFFSFPAKFEDYNAICLNSTRFNSMVYKSVWDNKKFDIMLAWVNVKGKHCSVSLYTDKDGVDVSEIAKKYGGGGHMQAAGFQCEKVEVIDKLIKIS